MALDNYADLKTAIGTWMGRRSDLTDVVDDMIDMFESWINRNIRAPQMEGESTASAAEFLALPTDFLQIRRITYEDDPIINLEFIPPSYADFYNNTTDTDVPKWYSIVGDQFRLVPAPNDLTVLVRISYWKKLAGLSASNTTNWLLTLYPDAYLYGCLTHGNVFTQDDQRAQLISAGWSSAMTELKRASLNMNAGGPLRMRAA